MVSEEKLAKKKKITVDADGAVIIKKKKKKRKDQIPKVGEKLKTKKKKKLKKSAAVNLDTSQNSSRNESVLTPNQTIPPDSDDSGDMDLFSSKSPSKEKSPLKPPPLKRWPDSPPESEDEIEDAISPKKSMKRSTVSPSDSENDIVDTTPPKKFAKKTKIIRLPQESPIKNNDLATDLDNEFDDIEEIPDIVKSPPPAFSNTPSDPLISQADQDIRDLWLLEAVEKMYGDVTEEDIDWNRLFVFNMSPDQMQTRFRQLLEAVPRLKSVSTLVNESRIAFCKAKVRTIPGTVRDRLVKINISVLPKTEHKKMNAFSLFSSNFDLKVTSRDVIKEKWDRLQSTDKKKLRQEAKIVNKAHGFVSAKTDSKRNTNQYAEFAKEQLSKRVNMKDVGTMWRETSEIERMVYKERADNINHERGLLSIQETVLKADAS